LALLAGGHVLLEAQRRSRPRHADDALSRARSAAGFERIEGTVDLMPSD